MGVYIKVHSEIRVAQYKKLFSIIEISLSKMKKASVANKGTLLLMS